MKDHIDVFVIHKKLSSQEYNEQQQVINDQKILLLIEMVTYSYLNLGLKMTYQNRIEMYKIFSTIDFFQLSPSNIPHYFLLSQIFTLNKVQHFSNQKEYEQMQSAVQKYAIQQFKLHTNVQVLQQ